MISPKHAMEGLILKAVTFVAARVLSQAMRAATGGTRLVLVSVRWSSPPASFAGTT